MQAPLTTAQFAQRVAIVVAKPAEPLVAQALDDAGRGLRAWMAGQLASMIFVAIISYIGLSIIGVPAAGGLALIGGLLELIPFFGPIIAAVPAVIIALTVSPKVALWTLILYLIMQQLQSNVVVPLVHSRTIALPPAVLLITIVAAGTLFGLPGVLLSGPLAIVTYVLTQRIWVQHALGKDIRVATDRD